jgi:hypothetical protein
MGTSLSQKRKFNNNNNNINYGVVVDIGGWYLKCQISFFLQTALSYLLLMLQIECKFDKFSSSSLFFSHDSPLYPVTCSAFEPLAVGGVSKECVARNDI